MATGPAPSDCMYLGRNFFHSSSPSPSKKTALEAAVTLRSIPRYCLNPLLGQAADCCISVFAGLLKRETHRSESRFALAASCSLKMAEPFKLVRLTGREWWFTSAPYRRNPLPDLQVHSGM